MKQYKIKRGVVCMEKHKANGIFTLIMLAVVAVVFFALGFTVSSLVGPAHTLTTEIEYVPRTTDTSTTTTTTAETTAVTNATSTTTTTTTTTTERQDVSETTTTTVAASTSATTLAAVINGKIPINTATKEQLMTVKGIGETYAQRIIDYREQIGGFTSLEQLMDIKGIGEGRYNSWAPYFTLDE